MKRLIVIGIVLIGCTVHAQDIHYSQFDAAPLNTNPALLGNFDADYRFVGNHRTQWRSVTVPYSTFSLSADANNVLEKKDVVAGILINQDRAGDSRLNTFQVNLGGGYRFRPFKDTTMSLVAAGQIGITNRRLDYAKLRFDNQYDGSQYNSTIPVAENFVRDGRTYLNFNLGLFYRYDIDKDNHIGAGYGIINLTKPQQSYYDDMGITLDMHHILHTYGNLKLDWEWTLLPSFMLQTQGKYYEFLMGSLVQYDLVNETGAYRAAFAGAHYRSKDAGFVTIGMVYDDWRVGMSYDINFSTLRVASNYRGALEVSVIYLLRQFRPNMKPHRICREYI
ncbi:MAG: PorP/SprF family type IX secretion system membrane protein [Flavobacteriales bacterium]